MTRLVAAMAMTHGPGLTGWFERAERLRLLMRGRT